MPRFNPSTGEAVCGVAGTRPSVDGVVKGAVDSISPTVWFDTDHILHPNATGILTKTNVRTNVTTVLGGPVNELSAGCCGTYLAWGAGVGLTGAITLPAGGLNRVITDSRGANSQDGSLVYIADRPSAASPTKVKKGSQEIEFAATYGFHLLKWGQAVWNGTSGLSFWGKTCAYIPGAQYAKLVNVGELWIVYFLSGVGLIAHKAISPINYHLIAAGDTAYHMDVIAYQGKLAVCYSTTTGESPGDLVKVMDVIGTKPTTPMPPDVVAGGGTAGPITPETLIIPQPEKLGKQPEFADLNIILAQSKQTDNALYQTVQQIVNRLTQFKDITLKTIDQVGSQAALGKKSLDNKIDAASYHTKNDEKLTLPNSVQLLAGTGITFDDTQPNKRTINSTGGGVATSNYYDAPLTDGNVDETDLIFANGECIIIQVPNAPSTS